MTAAAGLEIHALSHRFGAARAVEDVSLTVAPGEIAALLGPSGCGKSTVLRLAAGLETVQRGRVAIGGEPVADAARSAPPEARSIGLMFQDFALFPHLTVAGTPIIPWESLVLFPVLCQNRSKCSFMNLTVKLRPTS